MFVRKLPQYYCIVVIFSQTPKFIRSLHSFLDRKQTLGYTQSPLDVFTLRLSHTNRRLPTKATHNNNRKFPDRLIPLGPEASQQHQEQNPAPLGRKRRGAEDNAKADNK